MKQDRPHSFRLAKLEELVDEMIKDVPIESRVRACMKAVGVSYSTDPIERMKTVLSALEFERQPEMKKGPGQGPEYGSGI
jgi:hypothetical protein